MQEHIVGNIVYGKQRLQNFISRLFFLLTEQLIELDPTLDIKTFDAFSDEAFAGAQLKLQ